MALGSLLTLIAGLVPVFLRRPKGRWLARHAMSDLIAESVGWAAGSPFQLEMGFANLAVGILGLMAVGRRDGFRTAAIIVTTIIGVGATSVHIMDIAAHGNLAPGNTIQNIGNLLDPILLITLTWWSSHLASSDWNSAAFLRWQSRQQHIVGMAAAGIGTGFGVGYAVGGPMLWTVGGALIGVAVGVAISRRMAIGESAMVGASA